MLSFLLTATLALGQSSETQNSETLYPYIIVNPGIQLGDQVLGTDVPDLFPRVMTKPDLGTFCAKNDRILVHKSDSVWLIPKDMFGKAEKDKIASFLRTFLDKDFKSAFSTNDLSPENLEVFIQDLIGMPSAYTLAKTDGLKFTLNVMAGLTIDHNGKAITIRGSLLERNPDIMENDISGIKEPLELPEPKRPQRFSVSEVTYWFSYGYAKNAGKMRELTRLQEWLTQEAASADQAIGDAEVNLIGKLLASHGKNRESLPSGTPFNKMSKEQQDFFKKVIAKEHVIYGFASEQEAIDFLEGSTTQGVFHDLQGQMSFIGGKFPSTTIYPLGSYLGS